MYIKRFISIKTHQYNLGSIRVKSYPNQNTPGVKKVAAKNLKKAMLKEKDLKPK